MGLFIRNAEVERKARELASITGETLTRALDKALDAALEQQSQPAKRHDPTEKLARIMAATERFRREVGLDRNLPPVTRADFDALWEIPGVTDAPDPP